MTWTKPQTWLDDRPRPRYRSNEIGITALLTQLLGGWTLPLIGRRWRSRSDVLHAAQLNAYVRANLEMFKWPQLEVGFDFASGGSLSAISCGSASWRTFTAGAELKPGQLVTVDVDGKAWPAMPRSGSYLVSDRR